MKLRAAALALLLAGCSLASTPQAAHSPSPQPSTPATGAPVPTALAGDLPLEPVDFSCSLPVTKMAGGGDYVSYTSGFIAFPAAAYSHDANGDIHSEYLEQDFASNGAPTLFGAPQGGPPFFDLAQHRWVPASSIQSTADGGSYAYSSGQRDSTQIELHVVDVQSAAEKLFYVAQPERAQVADFTSAGVYLLNASVIGGPGEGVWLLNPHSGAITKVRSLVNVLAIRDGYAWVGRFDPRDTTPRPPAEVTLANSVVRVNLRSGAEVAWYYRPGATLLLRGFDSKGNPVISIPSSSYDTGEIRLVQQAGTQGLLVYPGGLRLDSLQGDGDRLWFGAPTGIYLFTPDRGLRKVFNFNGDPIAAETIQPGGFCR